MGLRCMCASRGSCFVHAESQDRTLRLPLTPRFVTIVAFSVVLLWIDLKVGMPASWTWTEGPLALPLGVVMWWLSLGTTEPLDAQKA